MDDRFESRFAAKKRRTIARIRPVVDRLNALDSRREERPLKQLLFHGRESSLDAVASAALPTNQC